MNGINKITARIRQDAGDEMAAIARQAREEAERILKQAREEAAGEAEKARQAAEQEAALQRRRMESAAEQEARQLLLARKQACIGRAFDLAKERLLALPREEYVQLLAAVAARAAVTGREKVILNARDRESVGAQAVARANQMLAQAAAPELPRELKESPAGRIIGRVVTGANALLQGTAMLTLAEETREIEGGLILRDGDVEINCAFETQLRLLRESMAAQVAGVLFP